MLTKNEAKMAERKAIKKIKEVRCSGCGAKLPGKGWKRVGQTWMHDCTGNGKMKAAE